MKTLSIAATLGAMMAIGGMVATTTPAQAVVYCKIVWLSERVRCACCGPCACRLLQTGRLSEGLRHALSGALLAVEQECDRREYRLDERDAANRFQPYAQPSRPLRGGCARDALIDAD
jgi:hypothetical protein